MFSALLERQPSSLFRHRRHLWCLYWRIEEVTRCMSHPILMAWRKPGVGDRCPGRRCPWGAQGLPQTSAVSPARESSCRRRWSRPSQQPLRWWVPGRWGWCWPSPMAASSRSPAEEPQQNDKLETYRLFRDYITPGKRQLKFVMKTHGGNRGGNSCHSCRLGSGKGRLCTHPYKRVSQVKARQGSFVWGQLVQYVHQYTYLASIAWRGQASDQGMHGSPSTSRISAVAALQLQ